MAENETENFLSPLVSTHQCRADPVKRLQFSIAQLQQADFKQIFCLKCLAELGCLVAGPSGPCDASSSSSAGPPGCDRPHGPSRHSQPHSWGLGFSWECWCPRDLEVTVTFYMRPWLCGVSLSIPTSDRTTLISVCPAATCPLSEGSWLLCLDLSVGRKELLLLSLS